MESNLLLQPFADLAHILICCESWEHAKTELDAMSLTRSRGNPIVRNMFIPSLSELILWLVHRVSSHTENNI